MDTRQRAVLFTRYVGLELKGKITARGHTAKSVAETAHRSPAAFNRWLNGRVDLPLTVLFEACEIIGVAPAVIIEAACERTYDDDANPEMADLDVVAPPYADTTAIAAKRGRRKADADHAE
ncbi:MAG: helix-turn-helix domain-containing protein [Microbacterium sp.]